MDAPRTVPSCSILLAILAATACRQVGVADTAAGQHTPPARIAFADVVEHRGPRDVRLWNVGTDEALYVRPPLLSLAVERVQLDLPASIAFTSDGSVAETSHPVAPWLRLEFAKSDAERLAEWSAEHQGRTIAVVLGAGVVQVAQLESPIPGEVFFLSLDRLSIAQRRWVVECLTGEAPAVDDVRERVD